MITGTTLIELEETPSTNSEALQLALQVPEGTVVTAQRQTAGRGQRGTSWQSEENQNLTLSIIFHPRWLPADRLFALSQAAALAVAHTAQVLLPEANIHIKWPNDILCNGKKLSGILIENQFSGAQLSAAVIGIGLNVNQLHFEDGFARQPTSLALERGTPLDLTETRNLLFNNMDAEYIHLRNNHYNLIQERYLKKLYGYRTPMKFTSENDTFEGIISGVAKSGHLEVQTPSGLHTFDLKSITFHS